LAELAKGSCPWRMAGRCSAMASDLHVDLHRHWPLLYRLSDSLRKLSPDSFLAKRPARVVAYGTPLLLLRPQAAGDRNLQSAAETGLYLRDHARRADGTDRFRGLEAHSILLACVVDGGLSPGPRLALPHHVGHFVLRARPSRHGGSAWMEQFHL